MLRTDSLLDAQVGQRRVQEGEGLVRGVSLHLYGQRHRHGHLQVYFDAHHRAMCEGLPAPCCAVRSSVDLRVLWQTFCLVCCQLDFVIGVSESDLSLSSSPAALYSLRCCCRSHLVSSPPPAPAPGGLRIHSSASTDDYRLWKVWVCLMHPYLSRALLAWFGCVLCVTRTLGLLDCQRLDGRRVLVSLVRWSVCVYYTFLYIINGTN